MKKDVRILLVGAEHVGKTSLILSLVSEEFPEEVPARAEEITIPADVTPEKVPTHIVDYSVAEQSPETLDDEIHKADVVCIVYDVSRSETIDKMENFWIPLIIDAGIPEDDDDGEENVYKPMILVGNKSDLLDHSTMDVVVPIMDKYAQVKTCIECSAKHLKNISEMFFYAQKAVLYPEDPLFSQDTKELTPLCVAALTRIFKICDVGGDGILDDKELNDFQCQCFNSPLEEDEVLEVKSCVQRNTPEGVKHNGLTLTGFLFLHKLFMQRGRHETTWTVLRKFGYSDELNLRDDYCNPGIDIGPNSTTELSELGRDFFTKLFEKCDRDKDNALSPSELKELFSLCPFMPWDNEVLSCVQTNENGWVTFDSYMALWVLTTYMDCSRVFTWLAYFGYMHGELESPLSMAVTVTRSKVVDLSKKQTSRTVFRCNVIGPPASGKTTFLQGHVNRSLETIESFQEFTKCTINTSEINRQEKYLILNKVHWDQATHQLLNDKKCDVMCFLYDASDATSFARVIELYENVLSNVPGLFVATKTDLTTVEQECEIEPSMYCTVNNLPHPVPFCSRKETAINKNVYDTLTYMAVYPHLCSPNSHLISLPTSLSFGLAAIVVAGVAFVVYRYWKTSKS